LQDKKYLNVGKITGAFGIKGWIKVFSFTDPKENILDYAPWILKKDAKTRQVEVIEGNVQGKFVVALVTGVNDRDMASELAGWEVLIDQDQLPEPEPDEYYWSDLIGLQVETVQGEILGVVDSLIETGANDVIIVAGERQRAIPFIQGQSIVNIDLDAKKIIVDWDPEF
jgi:16S rRNA processing protein RimM